MEAIAQHRSYLEASGKLLVRRGARAAGRVRDVVNRELRRVAWSRPRVKELLEEGVEEIVAGRETPYSLASKIMNEILGSAN